MGRPLNKKYFGNRNVGSTSTTADNKIGGEGIASINWSNYGSWRAVSGVPLLGLQLPAPTLPGGVQASWTNYFGAAAVSTGAGKTGLILNETYEFAGFPGSIIQVTNISGANAVFTVVNPGSSTTLPTDTQGVNITLRAGQGHTGAGTFLVDIDTKIVNTVIGEKGSGYTGAETITVQLANSATGQVPVGTIVKTTDTGNTNAVQNPSTNQENAIIINANTGNGNQVGDIIKQQAARRYKVKTAFGTKFCKLVGTDDLDIGEAFIKATDANGNTYFVIKMTAHKATLIRWSNNESTWLFNDYDPAPWSFTTTANRHVIIENA